MNGCTKNKREAQKALYKEYYGYAMSICLRYATDVDHANKIMNDGFLKIFKNIKKFDLSRPFKPWLGKIMVNSAIDHYHKNKKSEQEQSLSSAKNIILDEDILDKISYEEILEVVRKLPSGYRTVFNLIAIEGFKHHEVAKKLGISEGTSKSNYHKAKQKLQKYLENYFGVER